MNKLPVVIMCLLMLSGCADFKLGGRSTSTQVEKISRDTFEVNFCGNAYMGQGEVEKYALQRAADAALSKGFSHFVVLSKNDASKVCQLGYRTPTAKSPDMPAYPQHQPFTMPNITLKIRCFSEGSEMPEGAIDAAAYLQENFPGMGG